MVDDSRSSNFDPEHAQARPKILRDHSAVNGHRIALLASISDDRSRERDISGKTRYSRKCADNESHAYDT